VTLRSGSVWPAVLLHGAFNNSNRLVWFFFGGELSPLLGPGAQGVIGMLGYAVLALVISLSQRALAPSGNERLVEPQAVEVVSRRAAI